MREKDRRDFELPGADLGQRLGRGGTRVDQERGASVGADDQQRVLNERAAGEGQDLQEPLYRERTSAATAAGGLRVLEGEAGAHERRHVVDLDALQVLCAEGVHEDPESVPIEDLVVALGALVEVHAVL